jgi:hypothetical protein
MKALTSLMIILAGVGFLTAQEVAIEGEIVEVKTAIDPKHDIEILEVKMQTEGGRMVKTQLSPTWYIGTEIKAGDRIMAKGQYDEQNRFMAREIEHNDRAYQIRNKNYEPLWLRMQHKHKELFYNEKTEREMKAKIEDLYIDKNSLLMEAVIKAEDGRIFRAQIAPERYLENRLRVGDDIEIKGSEVKTQKEIIILSREIKNLRTQKDIILRNAEGFPDWREAGEEVKQEIEELLPEPEEAEE